MQHELFNYGSIARRPQLSWPGNAKVAFYVGLDIEYFHVDKPSTSIV